jgi:hypothetical protein
LLSEPSLTLVSGRLPADPGVQGILITTGVAAASAYLHQLWRYSKDAYVARVDETCALVFALAEQGARYWLLAKPDIPRGNVDDANDVRRRREDLIQSETVISGQLKQLQFLRLIVQARFSSGDRQGLIQLVATFEGELTGGDFGARLRAHDVERAQRAYLAGCNVVAHLRDGAARGNRLWRIVIAKIEPFLPYHRPETRAGQIEEGIWLAVFLVCFVAGWTMVLISAVTWIRSLF